MSQDRVRVRFAPSPTGHLHVGNARTALFNWLFARREGGRFILRVEDTDVERSREEFEHGLIEDLRWLGLDWDEGPDAGGDFGPYRQSIRKEIYARQTRRLLESGRAYRCFCSPDEIETERARARAAGEAPVYGGMCRALAPEAAARREEAGEPAAVRLKTPRTGALAFHDLVRGDLEFDLTLVGDPVLVRPSGLPAYNYAVVVDDHGMGITHVIRGEDHLANTVRQLLIYRALDTPPPVFAHLSMVMGEDNTRLSKRHGATAVAQFRRDGILPEALFNYLALLGWAPPEGREILSRAELVDLFRLGKVSRSAAVFDYVKLHWINRRHLTSLSPERLTERAIPYLREAGLVPEAPDEAHREWLARAVPALIERVDRLNELPDGLRQLFDYSLESLGSEEREILTSDCGRRVIAALAERLAGASAFSYEILAAWSKEIKAETGCKGRDLFHPIRVALTARSSGLDLDKLIPLVESGARLEWPVPMKSCRERVVALRSLL